MTTRLCFVATAKAAGSMMSITMSLPAPSVVAAPFQVGVMSIGVIM
jgi:hypothetical protein